MKSCSSSIGSFVSQSSSFVLEGHQIQSVECLSFRGAERTAFILLSFWPYIKAVESEGNAAHSRGTLVCFLLKTKRSDLCPCADSENLIFLNFWHIPGVIFILHTLLFLVVSNTSTSYPHCTILYPQLHIKNMPPFVILVPSYLSPLHPTISLTFVCPHAWVTFAGDDTLLVSFNYFFPS